MTQQVQEVKEEEAETEQEEEEVQEEAEESETEVETKEANDLSVEGIAPLEMDMSLAPKGA